MALIQITDLTFTYPGSFDPVFEHVSFQLDTDWRLGLTGRNGRGKTTLLRLLQGQYPHQGTITAPGGFEYFPYPIPDAALTPLELLEYSFPDVPQWRLRRELAPLFVTDDALYRPFSTLSGGEQAKILLALLFAREGRYLLIDEPTNHLDETGRALVSRYLAKKSGFLLVSHDRAFLDGCVDHILSINRGGIEVQKGNFSSWYENRQRQDAFELAQNAQLKKEIGRLKQAARQSRAWADKVESTKIGPHSAKVTGEADAMGGRAYIGEQSRRMQQRRKNLERRQNAAIEEKSALLKNIEQAAPLRLHQLPYHTDRLALLRDVSVWRRARVPRRQLLRRAGRPDRAARRERHREDEPSAPAVRRGRAAHRDRGAQLPAADLLRAAGPVRSARGSGRVCRTVRAGRESVQGDPAQAGLCAGAV